MSIPFQSNDYKQRLNKAIAFLTRFLGLSQTREQVHAQVAEIGAAPDTLTLPETLTKEDLERLQELLPQWLVILHNDDYHLADYVVQTLQTVVGLPLKQAQDVMLTAHTQGQAVVITCPKEKAEHYQAGLQGYGLTCTIVSAK